MLGAELLKLRRRWASYVVLLLLIGLMALIFFVIGSAGSLPGGARGLVTFPSVYGIINQFVFGLGSLLAIAYAAAIGGADWNWGVIRVIVARGESRSRYMLAKFVAVALALLVGVLVSFAAGILFTYMAAGMSGGSAGNPLSSAALDGLVRSLYLGFPVLVERAAIGFAVAVLLRSQLAGVVVGIVLYLGEAILGAILLATSLGGFLGDGGDGFQRLPPQWYQYLPISIGDSVLSRATTVPGQNFEDLVLTPVSLEAALVALAMYFVAALAIVVISTERADIAS